MSGQMTEGQKKFYAAIQEAVVKTEQRCGREIEKLKAAIEIYKKSHEYIYMNYNEPMKILKHLEETKNKVIEVLSECL